MKQKSLIVVILIFVMIVAGVMNSSFYQEEVNELKEETILSLTIDGVVSENFPSKDSGKTISSIECDNGAIGSWDYESWGPVIRNLENNRTKCQFNFVTKYHEEILNGTDPVLKEGLIPVTIENDGTVKKADTTQEWYSYANQRWANAVILEDETQVYQNGEIIPEDNIESYFVWIPKYRYKLWDLGNYTSATSIDTNKVHDIELIFGDYDTKDEVDGECKAPGVSGTCQEGDYMTHPAFLSFGTKGLWVGKFETGYKDATTTAEAEQNINDIEKVEIKPNVYSWRGISILNAYLNSYNYKREMDSHMMKNTEWGAVAYLQHSIYGSRESVRMNNNSSCITGYGAVVEPTCPWSNDNRDCNIYEETMLNVDGTYTKRYNTEEGYKASTTGNITGVYDMSGGVWEFVTSVMLSSDNTSISDSTISFSDKKYYDTYLYDTIYTNYNRRILGDATGEMGPFASESYVSFSREISSWYGDQTWFVYNDYPWFSRGSIFDCGTDAGLFAFNHDLGIEGWYASFRMILAF